MTTERADIWSYGGGLQSAAIAVLIAQGRLPKPERAIIADPQGKEAQRTWDYLEEHVAPLLATVGLEVEVAPAALSTVGLYGHNGDILMPVYTEEGKLPTLCSVEWKQRVVYRFLRALDYGPDRPVRMWMGISTDEKRRAKFSRLAWVRNHYPLLFDVPLSRHNCRELVKSAGLPDDIRSACYDCPHRQDDEWLALPPDEFEKSCQRDEELRAYDLERGGTGVYLHWSRKPLREVVLEPGAKELGGMFGCETGICWI